MMLASRGDTTEIPRLVAEGYLFDLKIDGVRGVAAITDGKVQLTSRQGVTITFQYPEVVAALAEAFPRGKWVLDGEIAVTDDRGLPSWPLTHKRNAQVKNTSGWAAKLPATYFIFDLLEADGVDLRTWSLANRRQVLDQEAMSRTASMTRRFGTQNLVQVVLHGHDGEAMWRVVEQFNLEGLVAKRSGAAYRDGRSSDWVKIKRTQTVTCLVGGTDPGKGSREGTFGALHLYLLDEDLTPVQVGTVGSGFSNTEIREVMQVLHHPDLLNQPPLIVEVEYLDVSPGGLLRQPVFQRIRKDATVHECTMDQLTTPTRRRT